MISSDVIRGYTDTIILSLLRNEPGYGYEISRQISEITEQKYTMRETTLYSAFNRLEKNCHLRSFYGAESNGKRRTYYEITPAGRAYLEEKLTVWELTKEIIEKIIH
jgi:PadR family transcriptional regulator PadR